ncbi:signal recognition particle-docking protein FtsY [Morganella morganii]|uniref:signal recognition particle-docking protein FtsY n=1 Tax=Morganella morganii TaxID=582 RepID=UPI001BD9E5FE|nr:signal recognition particle-docking protein FtsY [Morganella morganii]ELA8729518.1 signal recognition particle-docking protein FtsY [Morganella morganii]ELB1850965.1 signal recognition particle-docking protein FtsY [Morganella morganii]MBT0490258.1 signal recognition particle-docking protein FtsY [Morganella morganii subsp. morganii]MBT0494700.1 signal recognition particle-docking protein FtsY [Morganella morganii subsp. morganii]QWL95071.1 signal recognition particle-docking protein FtsY [
MAKEKKKGFFSWLGFGRKEEDEQAQQEQAAQEEQARLAEEQTRRDAEAAEEARLAEEQARRDEEAAEQARLAEEQARRDAEAAEQARLAEEQARRDAEAAEQARQAEEQARRDAEAAKQQRLAEERRQAEAQAAEQQRAEEEQRQLKEQVLRDAEAAKQQRIAEEKRLAEEQAAEQQRAEEEQRRAEEQALRDAEAAKQQRIAEDKRRAEEEAAEQQRLAQEQKQRDAEAAEQARLAEEQRLAQEEEARRLAEAEAEAQDAALVENESPAAADTQERPTKEGFFARLKRSLVRTRENIGSGFFGIFRGKKIDDDLFEELEEQLLVADVGVETTRKIITSLTQHASRRDLKDAEALFVKLREEMGEILATVDKPLEIEDKKPYVILMVGVNGVGKTTTIGKMARQYQAQGKSVMLAAGDTFRAAAVEQLQVWGERNNIPVVAQHTGADPASVIFDAIQSAKAKGVDVLIADTAGRLQNKAHLMEELKKIVRVMKKLDEDAPHEIMLTLDASTGQNAVSQARLFNEAVGLTGLTLTKLDGTAKGGVIFAIADQFGIPIRYIGVGEGIEDLRPFKAGDFIEALFARED